MSTSLIYHAWGLVGYHYLKTEYVNGAIIISIQKNPGKLCCPDCDSFNIIRRGTVTRLIKTTPIGKKLVFLRIIIQRLECRHCHCIKQEKLMAAESKKTYSKVLARYILELSKKMTIHDIAMHLDMSWDTVKEIVKAYLKKHVTKPKLKHLKLLAIDEISIGKHHNYLTVVLDLVSGAVVFVGKGKGAHSLNPFWRRLKRSNANIQAVAMDMSPAYIQAVSTHLPKATIVFDHFHVIKMYNDKLSKFRRQLYRQLKNYQYGEVLKGVRWLLLKNPENLDDTRDEKERLKQALKLNKPLAIAYYMKEELRQLWKQDNKDDALELLEHWINKARASGINILKKFSNTLSLHRYGILAYYDYPISTGPLEGTNNKIKTMQRQAYGFRDKEFFMLKILAIHKTKYALIG
jgi:transposase